MSGSLFLNYKYFKTIQEQKYQYTTFLNHFYFEVSDTLNSLNIILEEDLSDESLKKEFGKLAYSLDQVDNSLIESTIYISGVNTHGITLVRQAFRTIKYGVEYNEYRIPSFDKDGKVSENERKYLLGLKDQMQNVKERLYSKETRQENPNLTKWEFNKIVRDIGTGSDHDLIEIYLKN